VAFDAALRVFNENAHSGDVGETTRQTRNQIRAIAELEECKTAEEIAIPDKSDELRNRSGG